MSAIQDIYAFLGRNYRITIKVSSALFKFRKVLNSLQSALRSKKPLDIYAAQAGSLNSSPVLLRTNVSDQMSRTICMTVDMTVETRDSFHAVIALSLAIR